MPDITIEHGPADARLTELGVCVVGAGDMGSVHARAWTNVPGARVLAVCDVCENRAAELAAEVDASPYADYREGIEADGVTAVSVCVPASLHAEVTMCAAKCGLHVMCEKPIALTLADADSMRECAEANGVQLMIGLSHRFFRTQELAVEMVQRGDLGSPHHYQFSSLWGIRHKLAMHDRHGNGGPFLDVMCHYVDDMCRVLNSEVTEVCAHGHMFARNHPNLASIKDKAVDTGTVLLSFANGDTGSFSLSWGGPPGFYSGTQQEVWGPAGVLRINANDSLELLNAEGEIVYRNLAVKQMQREIDYFASCLRGENVVEADAVAARKLLEVSLAALESMATGHPVTLARQDC